MVGGERTAFDRCLPVFQAMGKDDRLRGTERSGQNEAGQPGRRFAQSACHGRRSSARKNSRTGLAHHTRSAVGSGAAGSWLWNNLGPKIAAGDMAPGFMIKLQQKDLRLARELLRSSGSMRLAPSSFPICLRRACRWASASEATRGSIEFGGELCGCAVFADVSIACSAAHRPFSFPTELAWHAPYG